MTDADGSALNCIVHTAEQEAWLKRMRERFAGQNFSEEFLEWVADNVPPGVIEVWPPLLPKPKL